MPPWQPARPTPAPTQVVIVTVAPLTLVTPVPADPLLSQGRSALYTGGLVLAGLFGVTFLLFLISSFVRAGKKHKSNSAYDHLDLAERRDYTEPADEDGEGTFEEEVRDDAESTQAAREESQPAEQLPHERLLRTMDAEAARAPIDKPEADDEGGYRVSRASGDAQSETPSPRSRWNRNPPTATQATPRLKNDVPAAAPPARKTANDPVFLPRPLTATGHFPALPPGGAPTAMKGKDA